MPFTKANAPAAVKKLPDGAQSIWLAAYAAAAKEYNGDEAKAFATAWSAVKNKYAQDSDGKWHLKKGRAGMTEQHASLPMLTRGASFVPSSINEADRTVDLVWTTGADVKRQGFFSGPFIERLSLDDDAVDLSVLNTGANLLDSHNASGGVRNILGVVEDGTAEIKGPKGRRLGRATVRFSPRAEVEPIWSDVKAGIIRNVSAGYSVETWERIEPKPNAGPDALPIMVARRWTPREISLVAVPADAGAQVRDTGDEFPCVIHRSPDPDPTLEDEETERMPQTAARAAERAAEEHKQPDGQQAPGQSTPNPPMDVNERPADPNSSQNEGPAPQVKPGTAPAVDPKTGTVTGVAPTVVGSAQTVVSGQQPAAPEAQPQAEGGERGAAGEYLAGVSEIKRGLSQEDCGVILRSASGIGLPSDFAAGLIEKEGMTLDRARQLIIDEAAKRQEPTQVRNVSVASVRDEAETRAQSIRDALLHRYNPSAFPLQGPSGEQARRWMGMPLIHMARMELAESGYRDAWQMSPGEAAHRALTPGYGVRGGGYFGVRTGGWMQRDTGGYQTTSDFASALLDVVHKTARQAYDLAPQTFQQWAKPATHRDYRLYNSVRLSNLGTLGRVREHGEYPNAALTDSKEAYAVAKYGAITAITREVIINDDLGVFTDIPARFGVAARNTESDIIYSIILANAAMGDGTTLFHANHGNLAGTPGAPDIASLGAAFTAMAVQKDPDGKTYLNIMPKYLVVPPVLWTVAAQITGTINPTQFGSAVPSPMQQLVPISEPRLQGGVTVDGTTYSGSNTAWFTLADPAQAPFIEYAYLEGGEGVFTETQQGFEIDGLKVKVRLDFGAKAIEWVSAYKNAG